MRSYLGNRRMKYKELLGMLAGDNGLMPLEQEPLSRHSTWRIGGPADAFVEPTCWEKLAEIIRFARENRIPSIIIGKGSNLLFDDEGFRGIVVKIGRKLSGLHMDGSIIQAEAGIAVCRLARAAGLVGLTGLEHTVGIPGTLGGLVTMNGGSQREAISDVVRWVEVIDELGNTRRMPRDECVFAYRQSVFQKLALIITKAELELQWADPRQIRAEMLDILRSRREKFPRRLPNCGSVFKSSLEIYTSFGPPGKLIEDAGLKGLRVGDAEVSRDHANFILNTGHAKASDVLELIHQVRRVVHKKLGVWMECEVKHIRASDHTIPIHKVS